MNIAEDFMLGTHHPGWLWSPWLWDWCEDGSLADVPLFISHTRLRMYKELWQACQRWALDSGAFMQLKTFGEWTITPMQYARSVLRYATEIGGMKWAAPQDWMCEKFILKKTGLSVTEHQRRTVANGIELRRIWPEITSLPNPFIYVVQGDSLKQYGDCLNMYEDAGVDLTQEKVVGLGSVCRRQASREIADIVDMLWPLKLHGFGVKQQGLEQYKDKLVSSDSMAWSYDARKKWPLPGHQYRHINCANCITYAIRWREQLITGRRDLLPEWGPYG